MITNRNFSNKKKILNIINYILIYYEKECSNGDFIICARTDAKSVKGMDEVIIRSKAYIDAGADMIFPEGLETPEEFEFVAK